MNNYTDKQTNSGNNMIEIHSDIETLNCQSGHDQNSCKKDKQSIRRFIHAYSITNQEISVDTSTVLNLPLISAQKGFDKKPGNTITIPTSGYYLLDYSAHVLAGHQQPSGGIWATIAVAKNGTAIQSTKHTDRLGNNQFDTYESDIQGNSIEFLFEDSEISLVVTNVSGPTFPPVRLGTGEGNGGAPVVLASLKLVLLEEV